MDQNTVIVAGKLAAPPELREHESGARQIRLLVTTRTDTPRRRVDVIPATLWEDPSADLNIDELASATVGAGVMVIGSLQRRFWSTADGRRSQLELVASSIDIEEVGR